MLAEHVSGFCDE